MFDYKSHGSFISIGWILYTIDDISKEDRSLLFSTSVNIVFDIELDDDDEFTIDDDDDDNNDDTSVFDNDDDNENDDDDKEKFIIKIILFNII